MTLPPLLQRLERAIEAYHSGDNSEYIYHEFKSLADEGITESNCYLAGILEDGSNQQKKDFSKAFSLYEKVAEEHQAVEGYLGMARLLYRQDSELKDDKRAREIYEYLLEYLPEHPIVCLRLGVMNQKGEGGVKDSDNAEKFYQKAIKAGNVYGMVGLACLRIEQKLFFKAMFLRFKASFAAFRIGAKNMNDMRLRQM
jgi:TPR repeat protein